MKHSILLLITLFILSGCGQQISQTTPNIDKTIASPSVGFFDLPPDTGTYPDPQITIHIGTGTILAEFGSNVQNEISRTASEEDKQNGRKWSVVSGYLYTYTYTDLGINITTPPNYEPYFSNKADMPILKRYEHSIHNTQSKFDYIGFFSKDPKTSLEQEIMNKHLPSGCTLVTGTIPHDENTPPFASMQGWKIIYIASQDGNLASNGEIFDKEFPENMMSISFIMNPKQPNKYYKISHSDCAPGPCTIFGTIEFLD